MKLTKESSAQIAVVDFCKLQRIPVIHVVNEGRRNIQTGVILKRMGMTKGVSDLFFPRPSAGFAGLWLELKILPNKPTPEQLQFITDRKSENYEACVVSGKNPAELTDNAISIIRRFYGVKPMDIHDAFLYSPLVQ